MNEYKRMKKLEKQRKKLNKRRKINKEILRISVFFAVLCFALIGFMIYFLMFEAGSVINSSYNRRTDTLKERTVRGTIYDRNGKTLAYTDIDSDGNETRTYPYGNTFAHVVGYSGNGGAGLEKSYNYYLLSSHSNIIEQISNEFKGLKNDGDSLNSTLDAALQKYIYELLGDNEGAAIALNPETGEIYAMVSKPDFNPNTIDENWDSIIADENSSVLLNRAAQGLYSPGSVFKIFTLYEYLLENSSSDVSSYSYNCTGSISADGHTMTCFNNTAHGQLSLANSFAYSCNCSFANIGLSLNADLFRETCDMLLFNSELDIDIACSTSQITLSSSDSDFTIMQTAFGQGETLVSPIHMTMVMSAIANDGVLVKPHLVSSVVSATGGTVAEFKSGKTVNLFTAEEASALSEYLRDVVRYGTAYDVNSDSYTAYGKTGTAQTISNTNTSSEESDNSWFLGYAEKDAQKLVVCVILEKQTSSSAAARTYAKSIFDYFYSG